MDRNVVSSARQRRLPGIPNHDQRTTQRAWEHRLAGIPDNELR
jgi:hypothetical protein